MFEPTQDDTFDEEPYVKGPKQKEAIQEEDKSNKPENEFREEKYGDEKRLGDLSLMKNGLNDLDLRKPVSVEKKRSHCEDNNQQIVDVIQHHHKSEQEPELLRDKDVKIIKQTRNERLAEVAADQDTKETNSDSSFERISDEEEPNKEIIPDHTMVDGVKWNIIHSNEDSSWQTCKKFERWVVIDGMRPQLELQAKDP